MRRLETLDETEIGARRDEVAVNITITDSRGFVYHYGQIITDTASARAALDALSQPAKAHPAVDAR